MPDRRARLEESIRSFQEQAAKVAQLKDKLADLRGQATNEDGTVSVTAAPSGAVLGLRLDPKAMRYNHIQLQQEILATIRRATEQAAEAMQATIEPVLGNRLAQFSDAFAAQAGGLRLGDPEAAAGTAERRAERR